MKENIVVTVNIPSRKLKEDLEIPTSISTGELIYVLAKIYGLPLNEQQLYKYYLKADNPKALLKGEKTLNHYGIRSGSEITVWNIEEEREDGTKI